jgi:hypothetical protein
MNEDTMSKISPGPYQWAIIQQGPKQAEYVLQNLAAGSGDVHAVWLPNHPVTKVGADPTNPEHAVLFCITGNGPNSLNNAHAIMAILTQREQAAKTKREHCLPIPTHPDAVAWAEYALYLEHALGIADPIPKHMADMRVDDMMRPARERGGEG